MSPEAFIDGIAGGFYLPELRRCRCEKVRVWSFLDEEAVKRRRKENNFTMMDKEVVSARGCNLFSVRNYFPKLIDNQTTENMKNVFLEKIFLPNKQTLNAEIW